VVAAVVVAAVVEVNVGVFLAREGAVAAAEVLVVVAED
jgi:hypothetical protein